MIIITSAAYVQHELRTEFGLVPPVYLPIGNQPLLAHQVQSIKNKFKDERLILSLPESFIVTPFERKRLEKLNLEVVFVPDGLSLAASILYTINMAGNYEEPTKILHGDTLIYDLPNELDVLTIATSIDEYDWYRVNDSSIWSGYFAFKNTRALIRVLAKNTQFIDAVQEYSEQDTLKQISTQDWLDLGHLNTYYAAREHFTTQRAFNSLKISSGIVTKSGVPANKIRGEARWFLNLPMNIKPMTPAFYGMDEKAGEVTYFLEYLPLTPLNELYVYGRHNLGFWMQILDFYDNWFSCSIGATSFFGSDLTYQRRLLIKEKTVERLELYSKENEFDIDVKLRLNGICMPSLREIANECIDLSMMFSPVSGLFHGDLCFSNVLYDARNRRIRVIDPRGLHSNVTLISDIRYDLAKLMHSLVGFYDYIIAGHFSCEKIDAYSWYFVVHTPQNIDEIVRSFLNYHFTGFPANVIQEALPEMVLLFISMLPLHSDNPIRQEALMCNALKLYLEYVKKES